MTFSEFVHYYLFEIVLPSGSVKNKTFTSYEIIYRNYIKDSIISNIKLKDLRKEHFQKYFNVLIKKGFKLSTIRTFKNFISTVLKYGVDEDYILKNYCSSIKLPKDNSIKINKYLTDEEIKLIFENCKDLKLLVIIKIALSTGMRINEILALTENDFNFEYCSIKVNKTLSCCKVFEDENKYKKQIIVTNPKSKTSNRIVYFNPNISKDIKTYISLQKEKYLKIGRKYTPNNIIFTNTNFDYINSRTLDTSGSKLYEKGVNIKTISEQLGHADITITSNIYVHLDEEKKKEAIKHLDFIFKSV
nr:site-specific integrase [uncultured Tyzzerella sp.]